MPCRDRDPCEEGEEFTHVAVTQRKWVYHSPEWQVVEGWHQANPWVQCRKVAEKEITEEDVRRAVESFGMKSGKVEAAPPGGKTLVDLETIVWTEQGPYDFELEVLETNIDLIATPEAYHWEFGDGGRQRGTPLVSLTRTAFR